MRLVGGRFHRCIVKGWVAAAFALPLVLLTACTPSVDETCGGLQGSASSTPKDPKQDPSSSLRVRRAKAAILCDADDIATRVADFGGPATDSSKSRLHELAQAAVEDLDTRPLESSRFPLSTPHRQMYEIAAEVERARDSKLMHAWPTNPWKPLAPLDRSEQGEAGALSVAVMPGEHRAVAVNVRSLALAPRNLQIELTAAQFPLSALEIYRVNWTGTSSSDWTAAELEWLGDGSTMRELLVLPGITQQIWIRVSPLRSTAAGRYAGDIALSLGGESLAHVPIDIEVFRTQFPERPAMHFGGWDYSDELGHGYALTQLNRMAFVEHLQARYVDTPWAHSGVLDWKNIDDTGRLTGPLDSQLLSSWLSQWQAARRFRVYLSVADVAVGIPMTDDRFAPAVAGWARAWAAEIRRLGRSPEEFDLLLVDEPKTAAQVQTTVLWARAITDADCGFRIWTDPNWADPQKIPQELLAAAHTVAIYMGFAEHAGQAYWEWAQNLSASGKVVEVYAFDGPVRHLDPYRYHRLTAWRAFLAGATAVSFWSFADTGGTASDNEFAAEKLNYAPMFVSAETVRAGKHMEAAAEGIQDTEYLRMLQQVASTHVSESVRLAAQELLTQIADFLSHSAPSSNSSWRSQPESVQADELRVRIGEFLDASTP